MNIKRIIIAVGILSVLIPTSSALAAEYTVIIKEHQFIPSQIEMKAGEKHRLIVLNQDDTPEEFESYELNREKIVSGNSKIIVFIPPLEIGEYPFFGEFNPKTAQGRIVVK
ncbi:MAG: cupredoxin domain-containing protein [Ghiorsea sp.]